MAASLRRSRKIYCGLGLSSDVAVDITNRDCRGWPQRSAAESVHDWESREERRKKKKHVMRVRE